MAYFHEYKIKKTAKKDYRNFKKLKSILLEFEKKIAKYLLHFLKVKGINGTVNLC